MKILCVCLGNICRSPLAEGILKSKLPTSFFVDSAGLLSFHQGEHPDERAIKVAHNHHLDISKQKSRPILDSDFDQFDLIYCMDESVYREVLAKAKNEEQKSKVKLFLKEVQLGDGKNVPDPYYGTFKDFESVYQLIDEASEMIAQKLSNNKINN